MQDIVDSDVGELVVSSSAGPCACEGGDRRRFSFGFWNELCDLLLGSCYYQYNYHYHYHYHYHYYYCNNHYCFYCYY
jgi:hypothetical protein